MGIKTIDLDPQSNLTSMFLSAERLEEIYNHSLPLTILDAINPIVNGDPAIPVHLEEINDHLMLIPGNLALSTFEDTLGIAWLKCLNSEVYSFRITSIFKTIIDEAAKRFEAEVVLIDVGPNLGAINRAVSISSDNIVISVASDLFSLQGIKNLGTTLALWKTQWNQRKELKPKNLAILIPENNVIPAGYIVMQYSAKESRPVISYMKWGNRIPKIYNEFVLNCSSTEEINIEDDPNCIGLLKHFRSLAPMSMEAHKPIFLLKPADGAIGAHVYAVQQSYNAFKRLTENIIARCIPINTDTFR
ncbi:MAG: ParA family protein [Candidatus Saccharimonadales bacterium]